MTLAMNIHWNKANKETIRWQIQCKYLRIEKQMPTNYNMHGGDWSVGVSKDMNCFNLAWAVFSKSRTKKIKMKHSHRMLGICVYGRRQVYFGTIFAEILFVCILSLFG